MTPYIGIAIFIFSIFALVYLFLISPRLSNPADMELLRCDFAHRGLWNQKYPENSLSAFEFAARNGYGIELDVRLTKDKKIVVFHDDDLRRMCGVNKKVSEMTLAELRCLRLSGTSERIPTFFEVLRLVNGRVPLLVEIKGEAPDPTLCGGVSYLLDRYRGPYCVESFSPFILRWFKKHRPSYARGQLSTKLSSEERKRKWGWAISFLLSRQLLNFISRPDFIAINGNLRRSIGFTICTKAFHVPGYLWTVRDPQGYGITKKLGYYTIFEKFTPKGK